MEDREKTAFCTPNGLFEFKVASFGLCNGPATSQRLMDLVLAGLQVSHCLVYVDVIVMERSFQEHLHNLQQVFQRLMEAGLTLQVCFLVDRSILSRTHPLQKGSVHGSGQN